MSVYGRYETATRKVKNEDGAEHYITRRLYNEEFGITDNPKPDVPEAGLVLWGWFFDIDSRITRVDDGVCRLIPPTEWLAWQQLHGDLVYAWEYAILANMDRAYCGAVNVEIAAGRALDKQG